MTNQEKLTYIETEREKLQKRLNKKTGLKVDLQAFIHNVGQNGDNRVLARAGLSIGWKIGRRLQLGWVSNPGYSNTTIFFNRQKKEA